MRRGADGDRHGALAGAWAERESGAAGAQPPRRWVARLRRDRSALVGASLCALLVVFALFGPLVAADPLASDFALERAPSGAPPGPSWAHPLGTDPLFRDLLGRLAVGARTSLFVGVGATLVALALGTAVGLASGLCEGVGSLRGEPGGRRRPPLWLVDTVLMRLCDVALAFPFLLLVTAVGAALGRTTAVGVVLILGLTSWTGVARLVRGKTLILRSQTYVLAARALGARSWRVAWRHVLPGLRGTLLVIGSQTVAAMILAEAVLGYLTLGLEPPAPSWGRMLHEAQGYLGLRMALVALPGACILFAVLGFHRLGEGLQDAIEPRRTRAERRALPADLLLAAGVLLLLGMARPHTPAPPLGAPAAAEEPVRPGGWLRVATSAGLRTLDPAVAYDEAARELGELLFARLLRYDAAGELVPDLAASYEAEEGGRRYVFTLRPGLTFHDGSPLAAADVKRSLERALGPKSPGPASLYESIVGFEAFRQGAAPELVGVRVLDAARVAIDLAGPRATFLPLLTLGFAAPVCASSPPPDTKGAVEPCGAGPFRLASWERGQRVVLQRFERYHERGLPRLDGLVWYLEVPAQTQRYRFEKGELDLARELGTADVALYAAAPTWRDHVRRTSEPATQGVFLNTEMPPFDVRAVRRAVRLALDPSVLGKLRPTLETADRLLPPSVPGPRERPSLAEHDEAGALALMAEAGYPFDPATGRGGYPEILDYVVVPDSLEQAAAEVFQQQLARIGLRIRVRAVAYATYLAEISRRRTARMGWAGWHADFPDWTNFFRPTLTSSAISDTGSTNVAFFSSAELDALVAQGEREPDPGVRAELYERVERLVQAEAPWIPTYRTRRFELAHAYVMGLEHGAQPGSGLERAWLAPSASVAQRALEPPGVPR
ncbi:MAG: ABC transporter permease subunit [Polyangiaceae bacterium]|nr:ABC transporter permease subunit [Polyangiaceae bacterium]